MMLDEEALMNEQNRMQPGPAEPPAGATEQDGPRDATASESKMLEMLAKQALVFLTSAEASDYLLQNAEVKGPEQALASAAEEAIDGVVKAADAGGVQVPPQVRGAALQIVITTLAALMVKAGAAEDPGQLAAAALAIVNGEQGEQGEQPGEEVQDVAAG